MALKGCLAEAALRYVNGLPNGQDDAFDTSIRVQ